MNEFNSEIQFGPIMGNNKRRFELKHKLGEGSQGTCYLALDHDIAGGYPRCVKFFIDQTIDHKDIVPKVHDARIAKVVHSGTHEIDHVPMAYVVYEYIDGKSLDEWINDEPLSMREVCDLAIEIIDVVQVCHNHGVFHRDLKPSNIIMLNGKPVLVDFGIATKGGDKSISGSPMFMAPEQASLQETPALVDLYGVGAILYWLLTGHAPNGPTNELSIRNLEKRVHADCSMLPKRIRSVVRRCLEHTVGSRYDSLGALRSDLELVRRREAPSTMRQTRWARTKLFMRRNPIKIAAIVLLLIGMSGYQAKTSKDLRKAQQRNLMLDSAIGMMRVAMAENVRFSIMSKGDPEFNVHILHGISGFRIFGGFNADEITHLLTRDGVLRAVDEVERIERAGEAGHFSVGLMYYVVALAQSAYLDNEETLDATFDLSFWHMNKILPPDDPFLDVMRTERDWSIQLVRDRKIAGPDHLKAIDSMSQSSAERGGKSLDERTN